MSSNAFGQPGRKRERHFARYREIAMVLVRHRLGELIRTLELERYLPFHWVPPGTPFRKETSSRSERTRMALEELGTTFIKVGQILSTRTDILPSDYTQELTKLQNSLQPLPVELMKQTISEELHRPVEEIFAHFDPKALGVASIGQAHAATLHDGTEVVVKVQKPDVMEQVTVDLEILRQVAANAAKRTEYAQQYDLVRIVEEIAETMLDEMNYMREGRSAEHFAQFFQNEPSIHIPKVYWEYTTSRVITLERIRGTGILDIPALKKAGIDLNALAGRCMDIWLKMVFEDEIFHADPHPGNVFVEADGRLGLIDFGMTGFVDDEVRDHLASAIKAIADRDVDLLVDSLMDMGAVSRAGSRDNLRTDLKHLLGHYPLSMANLRPASNFGELLNVVRRNYILLPDNTFLLMKTMAMAQSLGRGLDVNHDFFEQLTPHVEKIFKERYSFSAVVKRIPSALSDLAMLGVGLPKRLFRITRAMERGELNIRTDVSGLERHLEHLERLVNRVVIGMIAAAIILGAAIIFLGLHLGR
jgi:ubiquinone biosynthesis protein